MEPYRGAGRPFSFKRDSLVGSMLDRGSRPSCFPQESESEPRGLQNGSIDAGAPTWLLYCPADKCFAPFVWTGANPGLPGPVVTGSLQPGQGTDSKVNSFTPSHKVEAKHLVICISKTNMKHFLHSHKFPNSQEGLPNLNDSDPQMV